MGDLELEKFLFDLNGYLIIEDVLSKDETLELSHLLNDHQLPAHAKFRAAVQALKAQGFWNLEPNSATC